MSWNDQYQCHNKIWGESPSELGILAVKYMLKSGLTSKKQSLLDVGCGYGRDSFYLREKLGCTVMGIDNSLKAIEMANSSTAMIHDESAKFLCGDFMKLEEKQYDILFASNFYQLLQSNERKQFRRKVSVTLKSDGLFFLSTLSVNDPEHYGKGTPHPTESNSFSDKMFLHFCTHEELSEEFRFLKIESLHEHEYFEPRSQGETHHHILWILIGKHDKVML